MQKNWTLTALERAHIADMALCHTALERQMCEVMHARAIRKEAARIRAQRNFTPGEEAIAAVYCLCD